MEEAEISQSTIDAQIDNASKKQIAETARLLAIQLAYLQHGKNTQDIQYIHKSIFSSSLSAEDKNMISAGANEFAKTLGFVCRPISDEAFPQDIFQHQFIDMAEIFASGCEHILQKYRQHEYALARDHLISLVSDEKAKKTYASWWAPFKRAWFRGEGEKFISIARKSRVAGHGKFAGKTGIRAALYEYVAGTGKK